MGIFQCVRVGEDTNPGSAQREGFANLNDVLMADNGLREAQQSYLTEVVEYLKAELELKRLTGNLTGIK